MMTLANINVILTTYIKRDRLELTWFDPRRRGVDGPSWACAPEPTTKANEANFRRVNFILMQEIVGCFVCPQGSKRYLVILLKLMDHPGRNQKK